MFTTVLTNNNLLMRGAVVLICFCLSTLSVCAQWELSLQKDSIQVFNKPNSEGYSYYKANGYVHANVEQVFNFLTQIEDFPNWVNNCSETKVLERKGEEVIYFALYEMPWPVINRYSITRLTIDEKTDNKIRLQSNPSQNTEYKYDDGLQITRFNEKVNLTLLDNGLTYIEMYGAYDPGGAIPLWLSDKFMKYGPMDVILAIKAHLEK